MLDVKLLRNDIDHVYSILKKRHFFLDINLINQLEKKRKNIQIKIEKLQIKRNQISKILSKKNINNIFEFKKKVININQKILKNKILFNNIKKNINNIYTSIPNLPLDDVPIGKNSKENKEIKKWGIKNKYNFPIRDHVELGYLNQGIDLEAGVNLSGSKFFVLKGLIAYLYRILIQFMLNIHIINHHYTEIYVPYIVDKRALYGTGQLPKFSKDLLHIKNFKNSDICEKFLIPTAEVPLTNLVYNKIIQEKQLPIKFVAHSPCFRSEVGSYGKDNKGLIRTHQFDKVELVQLVKPKNSIIALEQITNHAEKILQLLELPYRKVLLCTGDMSFASSKTYDLEVWFPSKNKYYEISSCSNMWDFQSRRIKARYKRIKDKKNVFIHTLNGSGLAIGRTLAAIMENYQLKNGNIKIPKILRKYMNGLKYIK
ncbi:serine--tRNA ligase [Enterobacteriaceae endosymbiont of Donacia bicoloricornis]|uniref:serine--tRNA ligase n=1 Tax=Enterobacteriaceae endosymbiont of Donacia bicoloricornis TaxID=2675772 RepID=UPI001449EA12|nr:serine--tRNA ligase [Enterobacteriaceae endosymbiont of Donacia bicoloricornis]QJC37932.1 serine--tRNA ligase [Enterobacteriaceae endosymbiont of Donacia bicoloricornis]